MYDEIKIPDSVLKQFNISGRRAVITGGAGYLGIQFAETICELGGTAILLDININQLEKARRKLEKIGFNDLECFQVDITNEADCKNILNEICSNKKSIDILINSAALTKSGLENLDGEFYAPFEKTDQDIWDEGMQVNLTSIQIMCKLVGEKMTANGKGSIINIGSDIGVISPNQNIYVADKFGYEGVEFNSPAFYAVSKAGVIHLTKYLAAYWGKNNVRVNCISPAGVYRNHDLKFVDKLSQQIPMGRMALPNEFKGAIAYLCSDASSYVTGHNLVIDGGRTIW